MVLVVLVPMVARRLAADVVEAHEVLLLLLFKSLERVERVCGHSIRARELICR